MRLTANWRAVLRHAWSVRLILLAAILSGIEAALPFFGDWLPVTPGVFGLLTLLATVAAFLARFVAQKALPAPAPSANDIWETGDDHEDQH